MTTLQQYTIEVTYDKGRFNLYIPDLCLVTMDNDLGAAYAAAEREAATLKARYAEAGIERKFPQPGGTRPLPVLDRSLIRFIVRGAILAFVFVGVIAGGIYAVQKATPRLSSGDVASAVHRLASRIENLPPEKREQIRNDLRIIGAEIGVLTNAMSAPAE